MRELSQLLDQRIAVLDGAWGTMFQSGASPPLTTGCPGTITDVTGDPDLLNLTRPDVVLDVHRQYLAAGADITTTNTFTATSIGQADYGLESLVREMNLRGAQLARQAADEAGRPVRRRIDRPAERDPVAVARRWTTRRTGRSPSTRSRTAYAEQIPALADGGVDLLLIETDLRHAERQGGHRGGPRGRRPTCRCGSRSRSST